MSSKNLKRKDPEAYKAGAIACLKDQLANARTDRKREILKARIAKWENQK